MATDDGLPPESLIDDPDSVKPENDQTFDSQDADDEASLAPTDEPSSHALEAEKLALKYGQPSDDNSQPSDLDNNEPRLDNDSAVPSDTSGDPDPETRNEKRQDTSDAPRSSRAKKLSAVVKERVDIMDVLRHAEGLVTTDSPDWSKPLIEAAVFVLDSTGAPETFPVGANMSCMDETVLAGIIEQFASLPLDRIHHFALNGEFMYALYRDKRLVDILIHIGDKVFYGHRSVLCTHSSYFAAILIENDVPPYKVTDVTLNSVDSDLFQLFVHFAYTGDIFVTLQNLMPLKNLANLLQSATLRARLLLFMSKMSLMTLPEALYILCNQLDVDDAPLALEVVKINFKKVLDDIESLGRLPMDDLLDIISAPNVVVNSELDVFWAVLFWVAFDPTRRVTHLNQLMTGVRFTNMSSLELLDCARASRLVRLSRVCTKLLVSANWVCHARELGLEDPLDLPLQPKRQCLYEQPHHEPTVAEFDHRYLVYYKLMKDNGINLDRESPNDELALLSQEEEPKPDNPPQEEAETGQEPQPPAPDAAPADKPNRLFFWKKKPAAAEAAENQPPPSEQEATPPESKEPKTKSKKTTQKKDGKKGKVKPGKGSKVSKTTNEEDPTENQTPDSLAPSGTESTSLESTSPSSGEHRSKKSSLKGKKEPLKKGAKKGRKKAHNSGAPAEISVDEDQRDESKRRVQFKDTSDSAMDKSANAPQVSQSGTGEQDPLDALGIWESSVLPSRRVSLAESSILQPLVLQKRVYSRSHREQSPGVGEGGHSRSQQRYKEQSPGIGEGGQTTPETVTKSDLTESSESATRDVNQSDEQTQSHYGAPIDVNKRDAYTQHHDGAPLGVKGRQQIDYHVTARGPREFTRGGRQERQTDEPSIDLMVFDDE